MTIYKINYPVDFRNSLQTKSKCGKSKKKKQLLNEPHKWFINDTQFVWVSVFSMYMYTIGHKLLKEMLHFFFKSVNSELFLYGMVDPKKDSHNKSSKHG